MRFVFYIVSLEDGQVLGTNNSELIDDFINCEDYVVIHKDSGTAYCGSADEINIKAVPEDEDLDDEDD